ncbi:MULTISPECIES: ABC transporter permease [unclassified Anabaena]|uniref:ABC transporter permease n=1 Tax=unclassified Anabaena TaxID=2619674 RepID=UPI0008336820|nr:MULTISPECIES: ABC transporter permease [unclassified Anabaena]
MSILKKSMWEFREVFSLFQKHRQLIFEMAKREITDKYQGQVLGNIWTIIHPLTLIGVYIFIFVFVFKVKIGENKNMPLDYTTYLLSGLIPWLTLQEILSKSTTVIVSHAILVKQLVFPIEILPIKSVIASLINQIIFLLILLVYIIFYLKTIHLTFIILPLLIFIQTLMMIGIAYILSAIGVYFKDIKDFVQIFTVVGVYLLPIFYLPEQVPQLFRPLLYLNPFSYITWCYQDTLYYGRFEHPSSWIISIILGHIVFSMGYKIFDKLKVMFGNLL